MNPNLGEAPLIGALLLSDTVDKQFILQRASLDEIRAIIQAEDYKNYQAWKSQEDMKKAK